MIAVLAEWSVLSLIVALISTVMIGLVYAVRSLVHDGTMPGESIQWAVTATPLTILMLGGLGVARFAEIVADARIVLLALIPLTLGPWLAYRTIKWMRSERAEEDRDVESRDQEEPRRQVLRSSRVGKQRKGGRSRDRGVQEGE